MKRISALMIILPLMLGCKKNQFNKACGEDYPYNPYITYSSTNESGKEQIECTFFNVVRVSEHNDIEEYESPFQIEFTLNNPQGDYTVYGGDAMFKSGDSFEAKLIYSGDPETHFKNNLAISLNETYEPVGDFSYQANNATSGKFTIHEIDIEAGTMSATLELEYYYYDSYNTANIVNHNRKLELKDYPICTVAEPGFCDAVE